MDTEAPLAARLFPDISVTENNEKRENLTLGVFQELIT
jgi:hypothetical protein